jgi:ubiquinone/menaquinone biosynthesis C-methylase UbiE
MSLGRRKVGIHDPSRWVFNRMADVYDARPPYPAALIEALAELAGRPGAAIGDLGAGTGHLALPLAARGFAVTAVEPAQAMLDRLSGTARARGLSVRALHATAEALPLPKASLDLVVVCEALHFLDAELAAGEIGRVLARGGALAVVTSEFSPTPFMDGVWRAIAEAVPRRPREVAAALDHLASVARVRLDGERRFQDETPIDHETLERIVRSFSFVGPAMNPTRFAVFRERLLAIPGPAVWARTFTLRHGRRPRLTNRQRHDARERPQP